MEKNNFLMLPHPLKNFEIQNYYQNESRFNGVFSRDDLPKKKGWSLCNKSWWICTYRTHWIDLFCKRSKIVYFFSFGVEHVHEELKEFIGNKIIIANVFRVQANNLIMRGYFCIGFIDFVFAGKKLTDFTSLFSPYDFKKMTI